MKILASTTIGSALRKARQDLGITQTNLAGQLGVTPVALNRVEYGKRGFDTDWIAVLPPSISMAMKRALADEIEGIKERSSYGFTRRR